MTTHRTYTLPDPEPEGGGPGFTLEGKYSRHHPEHPGGTWSEDFDCLGLAPVGVLADFANAATTDGKGGTVYRAPQVVRFLRGVLANPDAVERFDLVITDRYRPVDLATLVDVMHDIGEDLLARPTGPVSS